jgi:hypothetical protein
MWQTILFRFNADTVQAARKKADAWRRANNGRYQIVEVYVNNAYAYEYRKLKVFND